MESLNIYDILAERDERHKEKKESGGKLVEIRQELHSVDNSLASLMLKAKSEALLLPKDKISNAEKLKLATESILAEWEEAAALKHRKLMLEQHKMMVEFQLSQLKDDISGLSSKVSVWEISQKREISLTEERTAERQYDIQRFRVRR